MELLVTTSFIIMYGKVEIFNKSNAKKKYYPNEILMATWESRTYVDSIIERVYLQEYYYHEDNSE